MPDEGREGGVIRVADEPGGVYRRLAAHSLCAVRVYPIVLMHVYIINNFPTVDRLPTRVLVMVSACMGFETSQATFQEASTWQAAMLGGRHGQGGGGRGEGTGG